MLGANVHAQNKGLSEDRRTSKWTTKARATTPFRDSFGSRSVGHLVTPNNNVLASREVAVGTLYTGIGLTDNWTIGFSPFALAVFSMNSVLSRWAFNLSPTQRLGFELGYFKSFGDEAAFDARWRKHCETFKRSQKCKNGNRYPEGYYSFQMEAVDGKLTYTQRISAPYRVSVALSYYYYIDEERPFSLRMDPQNGDRYALNVTSLHEIRLRKNIFLNLEGGMWGLNYNYPYLHMGATLNLHINSYLIGLGGSSTFSPSFPADRAKEYAGYDSRGSIHPEVQIQAFF